jgi:hypothetical protein
MILAGFYVYEDKNKPNCTVPSSEKFQISFVSFVDNDGCIWARVTPT